MGEFGWAYLSGAIKGTGADKSIQYLTAYNGELTGSKNFTYNNAASSLYITGSVIVSGTLSANTMDIIHTNVIELSSSGDSNFGNSSDDTHVFTGSIVIVSGSLRSHYKKLTASSYSVAAYDNIIGVSSSAYVSITLPAAATAGSGRTLIIKDEYQITRTDANRIAVSASGGQTIDHAATYSITGDSPALTLYCDGISKWFIY